MKDQPKETGSLIAMDLVIPKHAARISTSAHRLFQPVHLLRWSQELHHGTSTTEVIDSLCCTCCAALLWIAFWYFSVGHTACVKTRAWHFSISLTTHRKQHGQDANLTALRRFGVLCFTHSYVKKDKFHPTVKPSIFLECVVNNGSALTISSTNPATRRFSKPWSLNIVSNETANFSSYRLGCSKSSPHRHGTSVKPQQISPPLIPTKILPVRSRDVDVAHYVKLWDQYGATVLRPLFHHLLQV